MIQLSSTSTRWLLNENSTEASITGSRRMWTVVKTEFTVNESGIQGIKTQQQQHTSLKKSWLCDTARHLSRSTQLRPLLLDKFISIKTNNNSSSLHWVHYYQFFLIFLTFKFDVIKTLSNQLYFKTLTLSVPYSVLINVCGQKNLFQWNFQFFNFYLFYGLTKSGSGLS